MAIDTLKRIRKPKLDMRGTETMELDTKKTKKMTLDARKAEFDSSEMNPEPGTSMRRNLDIEEARGTSAKLKEGKKVSPEAQMVPLTHLAKRRKPKRRDELAAQEMKMKTRPKLLGELAR